MDHDLPASKTPVITLGQRAVLYFMLQRAVPIVMLCLIIIMPGNLVMHHSVPGMPRPQQAIGFGPSGTVVIVKALVLLLVMGGYYGLCLLRAKSYKLEFRPEGVSLQYGVINIVNELLLFSKVQDIFIYRPLLARLLGVSSLTIQNAMGRPETIPALDAADAEWLREHVLSHLRQPATV